MNRPYPPTFGFDDIVVLAQQLSSLLPDPAFGWQSGRWRTWTPLPRDERFALADQCTIVCQLAGIRARESTIIAESLIGALYGWLGQSPELAAPIAEAQIILGLYAGKAERGPVVTVQTILCLLAHVLTRA